MIYYPSKKQSKKMERPSFSVSLDIFKLDVGIFFSQADLKYYLSKNFDIQMNEEEFTPNADAQAGCVYDDAGTPYFYILFNELNPQVGIVAHESVHVAVGLCEHLGIPILDGADETLAYLVDYLVQNVVDEIRDLDKRGLLGERKDQI